jgi:hypothetical protein
MILFSIAVSFLAVAGIPNVAYVPAFDVVPCSCRCWCPWLLLAFLLFAGFPAFAGVCAVYLVPLLLVSQLWMAFLLSVNVHFAVAGLLLTSLLLLALLL